jgi:outer membrane protein OmpA-like peptidoglycan-associated protein
VNYVVKATSFSSGIWDEFTPVYYREGIVFCSNQPSDSPIRYGDKQNGVFKIFYVPKKDSLKWKNKQLLADEISTDVNDGPATFSENGEIIYFSRNNTINTRLKNMNDSTNKLGIYSSEIIDGKWTHVKSFDHNHPLYTFCSPSLTADGNRLYFSSDMPGGYGGLDIYYSEKKNTGWDQPINLGPMVNTPQSEVFPFACKSGKLFFATDGKPGFGGKDLFYTLEINGTWIEPVHLDSAINSPYDDFGLVTDPEFENGYFSSNRAKTDDIYSFSLKAPEFGECQSIVENKFCFTFYDEQHPPDTIPLTYEWDFGEGIKRFGTEVNHCFPGPGNYLVKLSIRDKITGESIVNDVEYEVSLKDTELPRFKAYKVGLVNQPVYFESHQKEYSSRYFWNFGKGFTPGGPIMSKVFTKKGDYSVKLGLIQTNDSLGTKNKCVQETIRIYNSFEELPVNNESEQTDGKIIPAAQTAMQVRMYLMDDLSKEMKGIIKKGLNEMGTYVFFDTNGIAEGSLTHLDKIVQLLKSNPELKIAMALHSISTVANETNEDLTENHAREIAFFLKQKGVAEDSYTVSGYGDTPPLFRPFQNRDKSGVIELIFMKE